MSSTPGDGNEARPAPLSTGRLDRLKGWLAVFAGGAATLVPGIDLMAEDVPPLYRVAAGLSSFVAVALLVFVFQRRVLARAPARMGVALLVLALLLYAGYTTALEQWTVMGEDTRIAIGFGLQEWSLTDEGLRKLKEEPIPRSAYDLMLRGGFLENRGPSTIWTYWSIVGASTVLLVIFLLSLCCWAAGWGLIARLGDRAAVTVRKVEHDARGGHASEIRYAAANGEPEEAFTIIPVDLLATAGGLVLRARDVVHEDTIRHFPVNRIRYGAQASAATRSAARLAIHGELQSFPEGKERDQLEQIIAVIRDILADFRIEDWEQERFDAARTFLGVSHEQVRAACAYVMAEHLLGFASSGRVADEDVRHIVRLSEGLQHLTAWLYLQPPPQGGAARRS